MCLSRCVCGLVLYLCTRYFYFWQKKRLLKDSHRHVWGSSFFTKALQPKPVTIMYDPASPGTRPAAGRQSTDDNNWLTAPIRWYGWPAFASLDRFIISPSLSLSLSPSSFLFLPFMCGVTVRSLICVYLCAGGSSARRQPILIWSDHETLAKKGQIPLERKQIAKKITKIYSKQ